MSDTPKVGEYWQGQGGMYIGTYREGDKRYNLILAVTDESKLDRVEWGQYGKKIPGDFSRTNGLNNTDLILAAEPENVAALHAKSVSVDGHTDFYWPAEFECDFININAADQVGDAVLWSSTQYSAYDAWFQDCETGSTTIYLKDDKLALRAVRRTLAI